VGLVSYMGEIRNAYIILIKKLGIKRSLERLRKII
jgi:hypothetical protein